MKILKIFDENGKEVFCSGLDKVSAQTLENHKQATKPEREIRVGDCYCRKQAWRWAVITDIDISTQCCALLWSQGPGISWGVAQIHRELIFLFNIFDVLAEAMKGKREYEVGGTKLKLDLDGDLWVGRYCFRRAYCNSFIGAIISLAIQHKLAEAKKCKQ